MITRRIAELRKEFQINTQELRSKTIQSLQELFHIATSLARGETKTQTINSISNALDERQIDEDLAKLEALINEAAAKTKTPTPTTTVG